MGREQKGNDENLSLPPLPPDKSPIFHLFICQGRLGLKESIVGEEMRALNVFEPRKGTGNEPLSYLTCLYIVK